MSTQGKSVVTLAGVPLAATGAITWKFLAGVNPHTAILSCYQQDWDNRLSGKLGEATTLSIRDSRGRTHTIEDLFILHAVSSTKPHVASFVVADRRWRWHRRLVARVYNMSRKTGDKDLDEKTLPIEGKEGIPKYDYRPYSLFDGDEVWTARDALEDCLNLLESKEYGGYGGKVIFSSFPADNQFTMQNVVLRDAGDVALARLLAMIPGANVYINKRGQIVVYNQHDLKAAESYLRSLPPLTWDGDKPQQIDKRKIRPRKIIVHYEREVECVMHYEDDYDPNSQITFKRDQMYLENVVQTVDPQTTITEYDPEAKKDIEKTVGPGTWVNFDAWLKAMHKLHGPDINKGALPWTFNTIKRFWLKGDLEGKLVSSNIRGVNTVDTSNVLTAVRALRESFRQTFRISRRYMERLQDVKAIRVALLDPVTGMRMPASVYGQACLIPTTKGTHIASRKNPDRAGLYYNISSLPEVDSSGIGVEPLVKRDPGPQRLTFVDNQAGILRITGMDDPYGASASVIPCFVVNTDGDTTSPVIALQDQDDAPIGAGMRFQSATNEIWLSDYLKFKVLLTILPGSPNNRALFHTEEITAEEVREMFPKYRIQDGSGPDYEVFVPSSEVTARFAWGHGSDKSCEDTVEKLIGLDEDDPTSGGLIDNDGRPLRDLPGFLLVNEDRELWNHSRAVAAETFTTFADSVMGKVATIMPPQDIELKGNMTGATIQVTAAPQSKINVLHDFPGVVRPISRLGFMSEGARKVVLGIVRF